MGSLPSFTWVHLIRLKCISILWNLPFVSNHLPPKTTTTTTKTTDNDRALYGGMRTTGISSRIIVRVEKVYSSFNLWLLCFDSYEYFQMCRLFKPFWTFWHHHYKSNYPIYISCSLNERNPGARFSKVSKSRSKISNLMITAPFYSHILDINRGSFHTRSFRRVNLSVSRYREIKNGFTGLKSFRDFRGTGPGSPWRGTAHFLLIILHSDSILAPGTRVDKST